MKNQNTKPMPNEIFDIIDSCKANGIHPADLHIDGHLSDESWKKLTEYGVELAIREFDSQ